MNNITRGKKEKGAAMLVFVLLFLVGSLIITLGIGRTVFKDIVRYQTLTESKASFFAAESAVEDVIYRYRNGMEVSATEVYEISGAHATATAVLVSNTIEISAVATDDTAVRKAFAVLAVGSGASFNFGLQAGNGGIFMENSSSVLGNVFANGAVEGANSNIVFGDIISAGPTGLADSVHATGSVWANTITDSEVDGDAYYQSISGTTVGGTLFPDSADQATSAMPISDELIDEWKTEAETGGVIASTSPECSGDTYEIESDITIGPVKIECDIIIDKNSTDVYLAGPVWVTGNIDTKSGPSVHVDGSLSGKSVSIIADNPADRETSSTITLQNSAVFNGNGNNSFILLVSQNTSAENGGGEDAINLKNSVAGDILLYAAHGKILIENSASLKEVTAYQINLKNSAQVVYESGLINLLFTSGPGGGFVINTWGEVE